MNILTQQGINEVYWENEQKIEKENKNKKKRSF